MYTFIAQKHTFVQIFARYVNLWSVTTRVCVVYMFSEHIHALNVLIISVITSVFIGCVCVWRLILKKNRESIPDWYKMPYHQILVIETYFIAVFAKNVIICDFFSQ